MVKHQMKTEKKQSYLEKPIYEVLNDRKEHYFKKVTNKINNYLNDIYVEGNVHKIALVESELEKILKGMPESKGFISEGESIIGKEKTLIKNSKEYAKVRKQRAYEEIKKDYVGEKSNTLAGFESHYTRNLRDKKRSKKYGRKTNKKRGRKPYVKGSDQMCELIEKGMDYQDIRKKFGNPMKQLRGLYASCMRNYE